MILFADNTRAAGIPTSTNKSSSPRPTKRSTSTNNSTSNSVSSERSSPSLSPRKTLTNVSNNHSRALSAQSRGSIHGALATPPDGGSSNAVSSDEDSEAINIDKLKTIRNKAAQQSGQVVFTKAKEEKDSVDCATTGLNNKTTENSAILIQKIWRGYLSRKRGQNIADILQKKRTQDYILKLTKDMEMTKTALENERKIQQLQMQAINALWKKVSSMQPTQAANGTTDTMKLDVINNENSSVLVVQDLTKTCSMLMNQVRFVHIL